MTNRATTARVLILRPGPVRPQTDPAKNQYAFLSKYLEGDILQSSWGSKAEDPNTLQMGNFTYHLSFCTELPRTLRIVWELIFYIWHGFTKHYFNKRYDVIICYGTNTAGISALILKYLLWRPIIPEIVSNPAVAQLATTREVSSAQQRKQNTSNFLLRVIVSQSARVRLLYPEQLKAFPTLENIPRDVFHEFSVISSTSAENHDENMVLFVGGPWLLKGVDVLIAAFRQISEEFPNHKLTLVGWDDDAEFFNTLVGDDSQIEMIRPGLQHHEVLALIAKCSLFVLPSRTEAMGRVLLEAMAAKKPLIASRVDGIPHYVTNGETGLLFESENADELAQKLREVLGNPELSNRLAEAGHRYVHEHLSEECYVEQFHQMIKRAIAP